MFPVSFVAEKTKQPRGGYIKPSQFTLIQLEDEQELKDLNNISPIIVGLAVDYLTRFAIGTPKEDAFGISMSGARRAQERGVEDAEAVADGLLDGITGLDDQSIINACKLATFDVWIRNTKAAAMAKTHSDTNPDENTVNDIRIMVNRGVRFFDEYGPIKKDGFTFKPNGYSLKVSSGDGDFLTEDTMWDFKVSKSPIKSKHTLQLLMYYIMGKHSENEIFNGINKIGFFNPKLNCVYILNADSIDKSIIEEVEKEVICY
ncbi:MAG: hypothetical protein E7570_05390 [Ruminococcaceae bacterium]|nr:hypothetical protein [Oscillospiraceae bacterium]